MQITLVQDSTTAQLDGATAYDSVWTGTGIPVDQPVGLDRTMLSEDKLYVVLAVVLIIWIGIVYFIFRTDRKLDHLERTIEKEALTRHPDRPA